MRYLFLVLVLSTQITIAQQSGDINKENATLSIGTEQAPFIRATSKSLPEVEGSVYLNEEWTQARVTTLSKQKIVTLLARFNAYTQEVEILKENDFVSLEPVAGISVDLEGKKFIPIKITPSAKTSFVESLVQGKLSLYRVYDVKIIKAASDASLLNIENKDRVVIKDKLYFRNAGGAINMLPKKSKNLLALLDKPTQAFIKKEKLSLKKDADLIRAFQFYNENNNAAQ